MQTPDGRYRLETLPGAPGGLPLVVKPTEDSDVGRLCDWLEQHADWVQAALVEHGALLFRNFRVAGPQDFERVARAVDDELKNEYLGTSPRDALTKYVFSASELPGYYPIPQHCEMSFLPHPPRRVFFCCLVPPARGSGETPLADFRRVWNDLPPGVRKHFEEGGIRVIRNYRGPGSGGRFDLWQLKGWDEMFQTTDRGAVEAKCREQGLEFQWKNDGGLRLANRTPVTRAHPVTGETVWHNHTQVFHLSQAVGEYRRIHRLRPSWRHWSLLQFARVMTEAKRRTTSSEEQSLHCTHADGREISDADMEAVREAIWENMVIEPWQRGDVVAIDNHSTSHGRLPYQGPRQVAVAWA